MPAQAVRGRLARDAEGLHAGSVPVADRLIRALAVTIDAGRGEHAAAWLLGSVAALACAVAGLLTATAVDAVLAEALRVGPARVAAGARAAAGPVTDQGVCAFRIGVLSAWKGRAPTP